MSHVGKNPETRQKPKDVEVVLKVRMTLDGQWTANNPGEDQLEYILARMNSAMGFRGRVKSIKEVKR